MTKDNPWVDANGVMLPVFSHFMGHWYVSDGEGGIRKISQEEYDKDYNPMKQFKTRYDEDDKGTT
jgi:hypothetical protein